MATWYKVSDTLPPDGQYVLISGPTDYSGKTWYSMTAFIDRNWKDESFLEADGTRITESWPPPTHWRHLTPDDSP